MTKWQYILSVLALLLAPVVGIKTPTYATASAQEPKTSESNLARTALETNDRDSSEVLELIGQLGGDTYALAVSGDHVYLGEGTHLAVLDVSDPGNPTMVGVSPVLSDIVRGVAASGYYAYTVSWDGCLSVIDVHNPRRPSIVGTAWVEGRDALWAVAVSDHYAYIAAGLAGMIVMDISDPKNVEEVTRCNSGSSGEQCDRLGETIDVFVQGHYAYVAARGIPGWDAGLSIVDISNPRSPAKVGAYQTPMPQDGLSTWRTVFVSGHYAYVGDYSGMRIVDTSDPSVPKEVGSYQTFGGVDDLFVSDQYAYLASGSLQIVDVSNPSNPLLISWALQDWLWYVSVYNQKAYVIDDRLAGFHIVDVSNPANPVKLGAYQAIGELENVFVSGEHAYLHGSIRDTGNNGLWIVDVTDSNNPALASNLQVGFVEDVIVSDERAYVVSSGEGLVIVDVSDPSQPRHLALSEISGQKIAISEKYVYLAGSGGGSGLRIVDISNPQNPLEVGAYETPGWLEGIFVAGQYAYIVGDESGFQVVDMSNPTNPTKIGNCSIPKGVSAVYVSGNFAYVATGDGLRIIDVSDLTNPVEIRSYETSHASHIQDVFVSGQYAYLAAGHVVVDILVSGQYAQLSADGGVQVVDISNPTDPIEIYTLPTPGEAKGLFVSGEYVYVADGTTGLLILRFVAQTLDQRVDKLMEEAYSILDQFYYSGAILKFQEALGLYKRSGDREGEASALRGIGWAYDHAHAYDEALTFFRQSLSIEQEIGNHAGEAEALFGIGSVYYDAEDYQAALEYLQGALRIYETMGDREGKAITLGEIGWVYMGLGNSKQASNCFDEALQLQGEIRDPRAYFSILEGAAINCRLAGDAHRDAGEYRDALLSYSCAVGAGEDMFALWQSRKLPIERHLRLLVEFFNIADVYVSMADLYLQLGDSDQAVGSADNAVAFAERAAEVGSGYNEQMKAVSLIVWLLQTINAARVNLEAERYEEASKSLEQAEEIETLVPDDENVYGDKLAYVWLRALSAFGARDLAEGYLISEGRIYLRRGEVYLGLSEYEKAKQSFSLAIQEFYRYSTPGDIKGMAIATNGLGFVYYHMGKYEDATQSFHDALQFAIEDQDIRQQHTALFGSGLVLEAMGKPEQALQRYQSAATILENIRESIGAEAYVISFTAEASWLYEHIITILGQQKDYENAFNYTERAKARALLDLLGNHRVNPKGSENPQLIERERELQAELAGIEGKIHAEWARPADERDSEGIENLTARLEAKRQEYEKLLVQLQLTNPEYAALVSVNPLTLKQTQAWLHDEASQITLVEYFVGDKETVIFVVTPEVFYTEVVSVTRQELRGQLEALLVQMKAEPLLPEAWQDPARTLYGWLVAPVREYLPSSDPAHPPLLGIIPHDVLHYLPFSLLTDGVHAMIQDYTLFYAPSASSLPLIFDKRKPRAGTIMALANPRAEGQPYLPYAVDEAKAVGELYGVQPLIGKEATEGRFKAQAGDYGLIHIAAHSDYNAHAPLFSAILLQSDGTEDGRLETHEIFNLDLPQTDLVTLSACQTHLGELSAGDELVGLERAFFRAGAPSLVTSLWPVDDASTATLMERFYTRLQAGVSKAEALRLAQMETQTEHSEPYYWAGFVLVGDAGISSGVTLTPEPTPPEDQRGGGLCGGAAVLLGVVGAFGWRRRQGGPREQRAG